MKAYKTLSGTLIYKGFEYTPDFEKALLDYGISITHLIDCYLEKGLNELTLKLKDTILKISIKNNIIRGDWIG